MSEQPSPLHPLEKKLLSYLARESGSVDFDTAVQRSGLESDQMRRAIEWLRGKKLLKVSEEVEPWYQLGTEGLRVAREGLPERRIVDLLASKGGSGVFSEVFMALGNETSVALGKAKQNNWVKVEGNRISLAGAVPEKEPEELLIERLAKQGHLFESSISPSEKESLTSLLRRYRGLVLSKTESKLKLELTPEGRSASSEAVHEDQIDALTPQVLQSGDWKKKQLRPLDVTSPSPNIFAGRRHPIRMFIDEVREAFISLGFEEIAGPVVQSALWNFDALFIAQQHSTREMQDTFYLKGLQADLSKYAAEIGAIEGSHERGMGTGSLGWRYRWSEKEAARVVLRTHTTAVTVKYLSDHKPDEAKVFCVGRVFRNEKPNYKHNPEFYQIEGVTVGPTLNVRNLISIISKFYSELGFDKIKFWPTYFPYTEPSLQTMVYMENSQKWLELGGMGVFRPEVTIPLGVKNPVLAWGLGLDRLVMLRYGLSDIRELFGANLGWLRGAKVI